MVFIQLLHANSTADQITDHPVKISFGNESLQSSLDKLEKQSNVKFSYNPADLKGYSIAPHKFQNEPLGKVLNYLFAKTHLSFKEINSGIIIYDRSESSKASLQVNKPLAEEVNNALADEITVTGKVSDSNGPLPGVSVGVEGTSKGVITNATGNYTLKVSSDAVLTFSSIGYKKQRIPVNNQTVINVTMLSDLKSLNDVIVVGYGVQKKSDVTGSIVSVNEQAATFSVSIALI